MLTRGGLALGLCLALSITVRAGQQRVGGQGAGGDLPAPTNNAIVGHVRTPDGAPAEGAYVTALRPVVSEVRAYAPVNVKLHVLTDASGAYRLDGLPLGECLGIVFPRNPTGTPQQPARQGFGRTFFPNTLDVSQARRVVVTTQKPSTADVTLAPAPLALVTGTVLNAGGQPAGGSVLELAHGDHLFGLESHGFRVPASGRFVLPPLPPGTYFLVYREANYPPRGGGVPVISQTRITINGADMLGVYVKPIHVIEASGKLVMDAVTRSTIDPTTLTISASPVDFDGNPGPAEPGTIQRDLGFTFGSWAGPHTLHIHGANGEVWAVKSIRMNGVNLGNSPIDFVDGHPLTGLEVEVARPAHGRGQR